MLNAEKSISEKFFMQRSGVSFLTCLEECIENKELVSNYDRLRGTNLSLRGDALSLAIDKASGRIEKEFEDYVEFCFETVFMTLPEQQFSES
jgi:hypothetical protein